MASALALAVLVTLGISVLGRSDAASAAPAGSMYKLRTIWGGAPGNVHSGLSLNIGKSLGDFTSGAPAIVWWNVAWDNNNRWVLEYVPHPSGNVFRWVNKYTNRCLAVTGPGAGAAVVQMPCDAFDKKQGWMLAEPFFMKGFHELHNISTAPNLVATVSLPTLAGQPLTMQPNAQKVTQLWWAQPCADAPNC